jgi:hypothetical protein
MSFVDTTEQSISERLEELPRLWHYWKACVSEELGELPQGFEDTTRQILLEHVFGVKEKLQKSLKACHDSADAMTA